METNCDEAVKKSLVSESDNHSSNSLTNDTDTVVTLLTARNPVDSNECDNIVCDSSKDTMSLECPESVDVVSRSLSESPSGHKDVGETVSSKRVTTSTGIQTEGIQVLQNVKVKIESIELKNVDVNSLNAGVQTEMNSVSFTKCQPSDSGTDDSESDSSTSSDSDSESDVSVNGKTNHSDESTDSSENERAPVNTHINRVKTGSGVQRKKRPGGTKYKDELDVDDLPPIEDLHITVLENQCEPLGTVCSTVNQLVVIESMENKPALNLDSLLFRKDGTCIGQIFDVFGPVKTPFYTVRFNSPQDITDRGIEVGQTVYCAPQTPHTKYVFVYQLMQQKGSDASWKHNYEVPDSQRDYSDDEEERKAKRKHHQRARGRPSNDDMFDSPPSQRKQSKPHLASNSSQYIGEDWYRARVSEMNQFNRLPQCRYYPGKRGNQRGRGSGRYQGSIETGSPFSSPPPPLIRPPVANNWNRAPQAEAPHPYLHPFSCPSQAPSYERLDSNISFANPMYYPHQASVSNQWLPPPQASFRMDNTRKSNLAAPFTSPHLPQPSVPLSNSHPSPWSQPPPSPLNSHSFYHPPPPPPPPPSY